MSCTKDTLAGYLADLSGNNPLDAVACPFVQGTPLSMAVFSLFIFGAIGLSLSIRARHPSPVIVTSILSAGVVATAVPGVGAKLLAIALFFGIAAAALVVYKRASNSGLS